jgi:hypothetical protein
MSTERVIKFRAWHKEKREFIYSDWKYGELAFWDAIINDYTNEFEPKQQFTGLHDKAGKEIYEGDTIQIQYNHLGNKVVSWIESEGRWNIGAYNLSKCKVVGNKYESPSSIEESKAPITR